MEARRYRKKPAVIEAVQWDGSMMQAEEIIEWIATYGHVALTSKGEGMRSGPSPLKVGIRTLEGVMYASANDYIIRGVANEFYPCKPDIFDSTYEEEPIEQASDGSGVFSPVMAAQPSVDPDEYFGSEEPPC